MENEDLKHLGLNLLVVVMRAKADAFWFILAVHGQQRYEAHTVTSHDNRIGMSSGWN